MRPKPEHLGPAYGAQFGDATVVAAYVARPPYPAEVISALLSLVADPPRVLDLGCGTGDIARRIAPHVRRITAVDPAAAMVAAGRSLPGGDAPNLEWVISSAEAFAYPERYGLVVAAESMQWMAWEEVLPRIAESLAPGAPLALVLDRGEMDAPWTPDVRRLIARYSTNRMYRPYDLVEELGSRSLFRLGGRCRTEPTCCTQPLAQYVASFHSRNGLSRERMGASAAAFDAELVQLLRAHGVDTTVTIRLSADLAWGQPVRPQSAAEPAAGAG